MWMRVVSSWLCIAIYTWSLIAPVLYAVENLLVLLLRHFAICLNPLPNARENDKSTSTTTTGLDRMSIRREGAVAVHDDIERLSVLIYCRAASCLAQSLSMH
ncbi:unnamed protein product [Tilletia caries]|nr:unnamed protein product [Tilletia caries]